jgi:enoyl-CoA hydratase
MDFNSKGVSMSGEVEPKGTLVTYHRDGHIGFITMSRPEKRNALNHAVWSALNDAIALAEQDEDARVIILQGKGKSFCAGLDLSPENDMLPLISSPPSAVQKTAFYKLVRDAQAIHTRLERLHQPTIALIHGHCLGAGLELVVCCDIRLCAQETVFALPEAVLGLITDVGGLQRLPKIVGPGHAREIAYRGHRFDAEHAHAIKLVNYVYSDKETLDSKGLEMADEIAGNVPLAIKGTKDVFLFSEQCSLEESLDYNAARSSMVVPSEDLFEAMSAHAQKRKGNFKGA